MVYMVLGYFLASVVFASPYIIRYVRIIRRESVENSLRIQS